MGDSPNGNWSLFRDSVMIHEPVTESGIAADLGAQAQPVPVRALADATPASWRSTCRIR